MNKIFVISFVLGALFLDFASMDEITTGGKADLLTTSLVFVITIAIFISFGVLIHKNRKKLSELNDKN